MGFYIGVIPSFLSINQMMDVCPKCLARSAVSEGFFCIGLCKCFWGICKQCLINHRSIDASIRNQANDAHLAQTKAFYLKGNIFAFMGYIFCPLLGRTACRSITPQKFNFCNHRWKDLLNGQTYGDCQSFIRFYEAIFYLLESGSFAKRKSLLSFHFVSSDATAWEAILLYCSACSRSKRGYPPNPQFTVISSSSIRSQKTTWLFSFPSPFAWYTQVNDISDRQNFKWVFEHYPGYQGAQGEKRNM